MFGFNLRVAKMVWTAFLIAFLLFLTYKVSSTLTMVVDFTPMFAMTTGPWNYSFAALQKQKSASLQFLLLICLIKSLAWECVPVRIRINLKGSC